MVSRPPSSRPSPQGEGETSTVSLKIARRDWPDNQSRTGIVHRRFPLPGGEDKRCGSRQHKHPFLVLRRSSTPNCHWPPGWDFAGERARPGCRFRRRAKTVSQTVFTRHLTPALSPNSRWRRGRTVRRLFKNRGTELAGPSSEQSKTRQGDSFSPGEKARMRASVKTNFRPVITHCLHVAGRRQQDSFYPCPSFFDFSVAARTALITVARSRPFSSS